jgi:hypothetical protein
VIRAASVPCNYIYWWSQRASLPQSTWRLLLNFHHSFFPWREENGAERAEINICTRKKNPKSVQLQFESILHFLSRSPPWAFQLHTETHFSVYLYVYFEQPESAALLSVWAHSTLFGLRISSKEKRLFAHKLIRLWRLPLSLPWLHQRVLRVDGKRVAAESGVLLMPLCHHLRAQRPTVLALRKASRACESWCKNSGSPTNSWPTSRYKCTNEIIMTPLLCHERAHLNSSVACASYMQILLILLFLVI